EEAALAEKASAPIKLRGEILEPVPALVPAGVGLTEPGAKTIEANVLESVAKAASVAEELPPIKMPAIASPMIATPLAPGVPSSNGRQPIEPVAKAPEPARISE